MLLFAANQLPEIETDDDAFFRRITLVPFPFTVPVHDRDSHLEEKLQEELPGILNWAIEGLNRLMERGRFSGHQSPEETRSKWEEWGDSVSRFKNACLEKEADAHVPKETAFTAYKLFCEEHGLPAVSKGKLTRDLKFDTRIGDSKRKPEGYSRQVSVYTGCRLNDEWADRVEDAESDRDDDDDDDDDGPPDGSLKDY